MTGEARTTVMDLTCAACGSGDFRRLFAAVDRLHHLEGRFDLYACSGCGLIRQHPFPDDVTLARYYPDDYYSYHDTARSEAPKTRAQKLRHYLRHPFQAANALIYSRWMKQNLDTPAGPGTRFLDVGCGDGRYLLEKRRAGAECAGVDISGAALERLRAKDPAIRTHRGDLWDAGFPDDHFDAVSLSHVLEHVREPQRLMAEVRRVLKPGGTVRVQVPNGASVTRALFRDCWMGYDAPRHLYVFSPRNLKLLFRGAGLEVASWRTIENSFSVWGSGIYAFNAATGKRKPLPGLVWLWDNEIAKFSLSWYSAAVNFFKAGDVVEFWLTKTRKG